VAKKGDRVFKLLSARPHLKILTEQKITDSAVKQMLNVALGISVPFLSSLIVIYSLIGRSFFPSNVLFF
jgi:hypothetical protein